MLLRTNPRASIRALLGMVIAFAAIPAPAAAQYFGRNQVQYRSFDFRILATERFDIYYYPEEEQAARDVARMSERWYARLSRVLDHQFEDRQPVVMYATHPHFQQTNIVGAISEGTGGVTEAYKQRVVLPFSYSYEETDHVLGHELVHAFQYDISGIGRAGGGLDAAAQRFQVPLWFIEGMAEYLSVGPVDPHTAMWLRDGALRGDIPDIDRMTNDPNIFPYRWGQALWAYVGGRWGDATIGQILKLAGQGVPYPLAFERILNISLEELSGDWHASIRRAYLPMLAERAEAREVARPLITGEGKGGRLNLAPVLSPDGKWVIFLSELNFIDIQLHLADAATGEVVRTLQKGSAMDPHFGSLRFISSAGTWSPDAKQFAFSALREGRDVIVIVDVERARRVREVAIPGVDEITNPTWSPDGRSIAFSGLVGGISDLFVLDLASSRATKLTDDKYSELHPSYSPDGRRIAFATDRGPETDFDRLTYGPYNLAIMDVATRQITPVQGAGGSKSINPQWTGDGGGLFFISDRTGIPNVFRIELATGAMTQVTDLFTGISGITDVSPALTVSRAGDRLLFTEFFETGNNIYALTEPAVLAGKPVEDADQDGGRSEFMTAALLPPVPRPTEGPYNRITAMLDDPSGLPTSQQLSAFQIQPYRPSLGLDYLGQPQVGVSTGGGMYGSGGLYGGIFGIFSDVLARHQVFAVLQAQGQIDEIGGALQYLNQRERWSFGGVAQRIPIVYASYQEGFHPQDESVYIRQLARIRLFDSNIQGFAQYPFSNVQRFEISAGLRRISQDVRFENYYYDINSGILFDYDEGEGAEGLSFNLMEASAALVYDSSLLGYTSPFAGQRYRFQLSPTMGELQFVQALADYRKYHFVNPFTAAVRGLHIARYGPDAEAQVDGQTVFQDMYLGQPWYVRGYNGVWNDCQSAEEGPTANDCVVLRQLLGSRLAVASAELRFPLIRQLVLGSSIGFPPIEGFIFGDAGISWNQASTPTFTRGVPSDESERGIMTSAGVGARINVFGLMIVEIDYVKAFARAKNWHWQFSFSPGF